MFKESQLFILLDKILNQTAYIRKGEEAVYFCPFCKHRKKKLEINVRTQKWNCWICNSRGLSIRSLFYKLKVKEHYFNELYKIVGKNWIKKEIDQNYTKNLSLPEEFIPLWKFQNSFAYGNAMSYLYDRKITMDDIIRYNIGYCETGKYVGRIIIPSFDKNGDIDFFAARTYNSGEFYKYMLSPWSKNIIGFELFINWNDPITVTEGPMDGITIKNNVIPLFGTTLSNKLKEKIILSGICRVNVVLDSDESGINGALKIYEFLQGFDIDVHLILLNKKDASDTGFEEITKIICKSTPTTFTDIIKIKLK